MMAITLNNTHPASKAKETEGGESTGAIASDGPTASLSRLAADISPDDSSEDTSHVDSAADTFPHDSSEDMSYISAADTSPHDTQPPGPNMDWPGALPFTNEASLAANVTNTLGQGDISKDLSAHGPASQLGMSFPINAAHTASLNRDDVSLLDLSHVSASQHTVRIHNNTAHALCHRIISQGLSTIDTLSQTDTSQALISVPHATDVPAIALNQGDISLSQDPSSFIVPDASLPFRCDDPIFWLSGEFDNYLASLGCDNRTYENLNHDDPPTLPPIPTSPAPTYGSFDLPVLLPIPSSPAPTTCCLINSDSGLRRSSSGGRASLPISPPRTRQFMNNEILAPVCGTTPLPGLHTVLPPASTSPIADVLGTTDATLAAASGTAPSPTPPATSAFVSLPVPALALASTPPTTPAFEAALAPIVTAVSPPVLDNGSTIVREPLAAPSMSPNCLVQRLPMSNGVLSVGNGDDLRCSQSGHVILPAMRNAAMNLIGKENVPTKSWKRVVEDDVLAGTSKRRRA